MVLGTISESFLLLGVRGADRFLSQVRKSPGDALCSLPITQTSTSLYLYVYQMSVPGGTSKLG